MHQLLALSAGRIRTHVFRFLSHSRFGGVAIGMKVRGAVPGSWDLAPSVRAMRVPMLSGMWMWIRMWMRMEMMGRAGRQIGSYMEVDGEGE